MKKEDIYRIALICFNVDYDMIMPKAEGDDPSATAGKPNEVLLCDRFYRAAELFCVKAYDWSFMYKVKEYTDDDLVKELSSPDALDRYPMHVPDPVLGPLYAPPVYDFAYKEPSDMAKPLFVNGRYNSKIKRIGNILIFGDRNPRLTYISDAIDYNTDEAYPDDFFYMIAYRLAIEIQPNIQPDNNTVLAAISQKFQTVFQALRQAEMETTRQEIPPAYTFVV